MAQDRLAAPERRAAPRAADPRRSRARPTRTATLSPTGTDAATRPAASAPRAGQIHRDAERVRDPRTVTERHAGTGTRVAQPSGERRRRPPSAENHPTDGTPKGRGEAKASGRPAPAHKPGDADGRTRHSGRPQPQQRSVARRTGAARTSGGIGDILAATLRRVRTALRRLVAHPKRAVRRMVRRWSSRVAAALRDLTGRRGGAQRAAVAALQAVLAGRNPVFAAMRAWFAAQSTPMKILVIVGLVLLAVLAPLLLSLLLLALAVAAVVIWVRGPATV